MLSLAFSLLACAENDTSVSSEKNRDSSSGGAYWNLQKDTPVCGVLNTAETVQKDAPPFDYCAMVVDSKPENVCQKGEILVDVYSNSAPSDSPYRKFGKMCLSFETVQFYMDQGRMNKASSADISRWNYYQYQEK